MHARQLVVGVVLVAPQQLQVRALGVVRRHAVHLELRERHGTADAFQEVLELQRVDEGERRAAALAEQRRDARCAIGLLKGVLLGRA